MNLDSALLFTALMWSALLIKKVLKAKPLKAEPLSRSQGLQYQRTPIYVHATIGSYPIESAKQSPDRAW